MSNSAGEIGASWPEATGLEVHDELDGTNAEALRRAAAGERGPLWILAARQTAARGRRGRAWSTQPGNLAASLLLSPGGPPAALALRSFVAALALADALDRVTGRPELFSLKWPNDVLLSGAKLAGILLESTGSGLVIGFGVNLAAAPPASALESGALRPVAVAAATGVTVAPRDFLAELAPAFAEREAVLASRGFAPIRADWLARAKGIGQPVIARLPGQVLRGTFESVDETGALVLGTSAGRRVLPAADVQFDEEVSDAARH